MANLLVTSFITLDGVMQAPGGRTEDQEEGFAHGGWTSPLFDEGMGEVMTTVVNRGSALLLGRKTYDIFAQAWPRAEAGDPIGDKLNSMPKYVASRSLDSVGWTNSTLLSEPVPEAVARLKNELDGEIQVHGSGDLIQTLITHDLVDEYHLLVFPVLLGTGKRLFGDGVIPAKLRLTDQSLSSTGVTISTYRREGEPEYGEMGV